jgi:hypothetical protein
MPAAEAAECNPCMGGGEDYCGPMLGLVGAWKCCPPWSGCKRDRLPLRGVGRASAHLLCSEDCGATCDDNDNALCSPFGVIRLSHDAAGIRDDIGDCSWDDL